MLRKIKKTRVQKAKTWSEKTSYRCRKYSIEINVLTRNIEVIIKNRLTKRFTIRYESKQDNFNSIKIASERAARERKRERERERERERNFDLAWTRGTAALDLN